MVVSKFRDKEIPTKLTQGAQGSGLLKLGPNDGNFAKLWKKLGQCGFIQVYMAVASAQRSFHDESR
jgi:hypothetical protein